MDKIVEMRNLMKDKTVITIGHKISRSAIVTAPLYVVEMEQ